MNHTCSSEEPDRLGSLPAELLKWIVESAYDPENPGALHGLSQKCSVMRQVCTPFTARQIRMVHPCDNESIMDRLVLDSINFSKFKFRWNYPYQYTEVIRTNGFPRIQHSRESSPCDSMAFESPCSSGVGETDEDCSLNETNPNKDETDLAKGSPIDDGKISRSYISSAQKYKAPIAPFVQLKRVDLDPRLGYPSIAERSHDALNIESHGDGLSFDQVGKQHTFDDVLLDLSTAAVMVLESLTVAWKSKAYSGNGPGEVTITAPGPAWGVLRFSRDESLFKDQMLKNPTAWDPIVATMKVTYELHTHWHYEGRDIQSYWDDSHGAPHDQNANVAVVSQEFDREVVHLEDSVLDALNLLVDSGLEVTRQWHAHGATDQEYDDMAERVKIYWIEGVHKDDLVFVRGNTA